MKLGDSVGDTVGNKDGANVAVVIEKDGREEYQIRMCEIFDSIYNTKFRHTQTYLRASVGLRLGEI